MSATVREMISPEEARDLILSHVAPLPVERVGLLDAVGRVAAEDLCSDIDVSPFDHSAMDGFALRASQIAAASQDAPVQLRVIAEIGAGSIYDGPIGEGECVRIMTGAPLPDAADSVVKYEIVAVVEGDGKPGSTVAFAAPCDLGSNVRYAGEECKRGEVVVCAGDVINAAGVGFLASCGMLEVPVFARPRVAIIATGSELVNPDEVPAKGKIRNSNSYAMAACVKQAGGIPTVLPICEDTYEGLRDAVSSALADHDFVITTGGAANGDYDFIKPVVDELGDLLMTTVNMRPGKAQTFGIVNGGPVFGLPGNPAAAYCGFEVLIRPALRKMQGYAASERPSVMAHLSKDTRKKDPRRIYLRGALTKDAAGELVFTPDRNQSSGSFGAIQRSSALGVMAEGLESKKAGDLVSCILIDVPEEVVL